MGCDGKRKTARTRGTEELEGRRYVATFTSLPRDGSIFGLFVQPSIPRLKLHLLAAGLSSSKATGYRNHQHESIY